MKIISLLFIFIFSIHSALFANSIHIKEALNLKIYNEKYWLMLLHYENNKSLINTKEFFIAKDGNVDPKAELLATLRSFDNNSSMICKYPARYKWLNNKLQLNLKKPNCQELNQLKAKQFNSISVIFASPRYDSPGSTFGHTFLRFGSPLIDYAVNYVAPIPANIGNFDYVYGGLTGKFKSYYKYLPYAIISNEYRKEESRDILQYKINFSQDEVTNIILHLYEIKDVNQDYYFISKNCSSELLKLLDMGNYDSSLSQYLNKSTIPIDIIYILENNNLIDKILEEPSQIKILYKNIATLTFKEKKILKNILFKKRAIGKFDRDKKITNAKKALLIKIAISYLELKSLDSEFNQQNMKKLIKLVKLRLKYKITKDQMRSKIVKNNPITNNTKKIYISTLSQENINYNIVGGRYLYKNRYDLQNSTIDYGSVELLDLSLRYNNRSIISLNKFLLIKLEALPSSNYLFIKPTTTIESGIRRIVHFDDKLYKYGYYQKGINYELSSNILFNNSISIGVIHNQNITYNSTFKSTLEYHHKNQFISQIKYKKELYSTSKYSAQIIFSNYIKISKNSTLNSTILNTNYNNSNYTQYQLSYNIFF